MLCTVNYNDKYDEEKVKVGEEEKTEGVAGRAGPKGELVVYEEEILDKKRKKIIT